MYYLVLCPLFVIFACAIDYHEYLIYPSTNLQTEVQVQDLDYEIHGCAGGKENVYVMRIPGQVVPRVWLARISRNSVRHLMHSDKVNSLLLQETLLTRFR